MNNSNMSMRQYQALARRHLSDAARENFPRMHVLAAMIKREMDDGLSVGEARFKALAKIDSLTFEEEMAMGEEFVGVSGEVLTEAIFPELSESEVAEIVEEPDRDTREFMRSVHGRHWHCRKRGAFLSAFLSRNFRPSFNTSWRATLRPSPARRGTRRAPRACRSAAKASDGGGSDDGADGDSEPPRPRLTPPAPSTAHNPILIRDLNRLHPSRRLALPRSWRLERGRSA